MASVLKLFIFTFLVARGAKSMASAPEPPPEPAAESSLSLAGRLQSTKSSNCWVSMLEIRSCIGELVMFFINGETYIGPGCCHAIRTVVHECRPAMLDVLGFTAEESHLLDDYCEGAEAMAPPPPLPSTLTAKPDKSILEED